MKWKKNYMKLKEWNFTPHKKKYDKEWIPTTEQVMEKGLRNNMVTVFTTKRIKEIVRVNVFVATEKINEILH